MNETAIKLVARWARQALPEFQKLFPADDRVSKAVECAENYKQFSRRQIHEILDGVIVASVNCNTASASYAARLARESLMTILVYEPYKNLSHTVRYVSEAFVFQEESEKYLKKQMEEAQIPYSDKW